MAGGEALWHVRVTLLLLGLEVSLFLSAWSLDEHSQHQSPPEVVTPLKVSGTGKHMKASGWLSYSLHFGGQRHIVHMKVKKSFLARNLPVFTYTDQGALLEDQPFIPNDCYYHGYVEGDPESLVVLSTCFEGFQGMLQVKDITYEIKPKMFSDKFEHLVYKMDSEETQFPGLRCGLTEEEIERQLKHQGSGNNTLRQSDYLGWWTHQSNIELAIVVERSRYVSLDKNETLVKKEVVSVFNIVDSFYKAMEVDTIICALEIWTGRSPFSVKDINVGLTEFCKWKNNNLVNRAPHDAAHIIVDMIYNFLGLAWVGKVCIQTYNCAILSYLGTKEVDFAITTAHELGHNLGMKHDEDKCVCGHKYCLMYPVKAPANRFSNCSYGEYWNFNVKSSCMRNRVPEEPTPLEQRCGNLVIEEGEACDCGSVKSCEKDPCCFSNCTLKPGAVCASGLCCHNCSFIASGKVCRAEANRCDLPEWCNGSSYHCPEDVYRQEGTPCENDGFCFEKKCRNRDEQCREIFGKNARGASASCYKEINKEGDRFGHCGIQNNEYVKCHKSDILCGRVQCENVSSIPVFGPHLTVLTTALNDITCWGIDYHHGISIPDIGDVKDGTECGENHMCFNRKCVNVTSLQNLCSNRICNNSGVCNNKQHCHCNFGWAPPYCRKIGDGGSVDSGPPPRREIKKEKKFPFAILLLSLIPLLVLASLLVLLAMRKKQEKNPEETAPPPPPPAPPPPPPPPPPHAPHSAPPPPKGKPKGAKK